MAGDKPGRQKKGRLTPLDVPNAEELLTVDQVAAELHVTRNRIRALCNEGRLGRKFGARAWAITRGELEALRQELAGESNSRLRQVAEEAGEYQAGG